MVNQEKIVGLIYYYVKNTGDTAFLQDMVGGKTILDHAIAHATFQIENGDTCHLAPVDVV
jgi:archaellum component FlaG (FlaF/FlaG flagellin family)